MRSSGKSIGASVGRMIFAGQSSKRIEHHLSQVGPEKIHAALSKRGVTDVKIEDIAKAMTGETRGRAGWTQGKLKNVVEALQDVGVAKSAKSASHMVLQASKNIEKPVEAPHMSANQLKARYKQMSRERREEANAEEDGQEHLGVLDRARGAMGRANAASVENPPLEEEAEKDGGNGVREAREQLRKNIELQPKIRVPKPNNPFESGSGFQA